MALIIILARRLPPHLRFLRGEHYVRIESGKGELGIDLIGDDNIFPWRWKIRPADFNYPISE